MELLAQRHMQWAVDEIIRLLHADLPARLREIARAQRGLRGCRPGGHFFIEQLRRPAAPRQRASADGEDQPAVTQRRMIHPRHAQIGCAAHERHILRVLRQHKRPRLEHEDAPAARGVGDEKMLRDDGPESAAADDDRVEVAPASADGLCRAVEGFLQRIAEKPSHVIEAECGRFGCDHGRCVAR